MSILIQLFNVQDLRDLGPEKIRIIRDTIRSHFNPTIDTTVNTTLMDITRNVPEESPPSWVDIPMLARILERVREVIIQIGLSDTSALVEPGEIANLREPLYPQVFQPVFFNLLNDEQKRILEMAISCEVANVNYYEHLKKLRDIAYSTFRLLMNNISPRDPDTYYSPFNPDGPFSDIVRRYES